MTLAHGYSIEAACDGDHCKNAGTYDCQGSWYGRNKREAFAAMKASGWSHRGHRCWCRLCTIANSPEPKRESVADGVAGHVASGSETRDAYRLWCYGARAGRADTRPP